jgi:hypothetical protein
MLEAYSQGVLDELLAQIPPRRGWDFSRMNVLRQPVPWNYHDLVVRYLAVATTSTPGSRSNRLVPAHA